VVILLVVAAAVCLACALAWRSDRRRKVTIDRRNPAVESDIARGFEQAVIHRIDSGNQGSL
jgi:hypothetical protein